jgi:2-oxoglutarate ferredoxin oxidoreductase subunit alpha
VDTAATIFARACAAGGLHLFGRREYYSNIMGRHSYYDVRVARHPLGCHRDTVDLLTTFEDETLTRHAISVVRGGAIIHDAAAADVGLERVTFLDARAREDLTAYLEERDLPVSTSGMLEDARLRGALTFAVPFHETSAKLAAEREIPQSVADRTLNTIAVAISCALLQFDAEYLRKALELTFRGRDKIIDMNARVVELAYQFVAAELDRDDFNFRLDGLEGKEQRLFVNGNQAVAMGKLAAGMTFQTYYPISPATDESVFLEANETFPTLNGAEGSVIVVQTEDELAAIAMASGAALTGARSATATSGPGFSLMAEGLGWLGINEVPLVVTLYQRGSPATGMPTRSEQGDLQFAVHGGHGEFPRIVLSSGDLTEAFYDAAQAFNYAERYQTVVIHLLDKALSSMSQTLVPFDTSRIRIERGDIYQPPARPDGSGPFPRFQPTESGVSERALLGQPEGMHWLTGGEHTIYGRVTEDPVVREQQMEKRMRKLDLMLSELRRDEKLKVYGDEAARFTIVSWGSNKGAILEAMQRLADDGMAARLVQVRLLWPFPSDALEPLIAQADPLVAVESNFSGQFAQLMREATGRRADHLVVKYNGRPMSALELHAALKSVYDGKAERKVVLRNPNE